jgi:hypothetical protein
VNTASLRIRGSAGIRGLSSSLFVKRRAALACFASALVLYGLESIAWPLGGGRDATTYLMYYLDMWHAHPAYPALMLFRTPLAPLVYGPPLQLGGPVLAEAVMAVIYAASVLAFAAAAREFGRLPAVLTAVALLAYPGYSALFHQISSDPIFAFVFSLWTLTVIRAVRWPQTRRFLTLGLLFFALVMARPGSQVLLVFALVPLVLRGTWRSRLTWAGSFLGVSIGLLLLWSGYNDLRYGSFVVARAGWANVPFYRVFTMEKLVRAENGPASRELAAAVRRDLLSKTPYPQLGVKTPDRYFEIGSDRMWSDVVWIVDREWGWHSDYAILRKVSIETIRAHFHLYARDVAAGVWDELRYPYLLNAPQAPPSARRGPSRTLSAARPVSTPPSSSSSDYGGRYWWLASTPNGRPPVPSRVARLVRGVGSLQRDIPERSGSAGMARVLNRISRVFPWSVIWLALGLVALAVRRPRGAFALIVAVGLALGMILFTELGEPPGLAYGLPFAPVFVLSAIAAATGPRRARGRRVTA